MKKILFLLLITGAVHGQVPKDATVITIPGITFNQVCNALLDSGYSIAMKDNDLQTVRTEPVQYKKYANAKYIFNVRVKDSTVFLSGTFTAAGGEIWRDEPIRNFTNKKGVLNEKSLYGYSFKLMNDFAVAFNKPVSYLVK